MKLYQCMHHINTMCHEQGIQILHFFVFELSSLVLVAYSKWCPGHNSYTVWNIFMKLYRCMHDIELMCHEQGRQLWHFLSTRLFGRPYVPLSCPGHNSKTLKNIFMKLHRCIHHSKTMCHEQGRQLLHFWFLNYFPLI